MDKLPLDPEKEIFKWGPSTMRTFYMADFLEGIFSRNYFRKAFPKEEWPKGFALYRKGQMCFVNKLSEIQKAGRSVFEKFMIPLEERKIIFDLWQKDLKQVRKMEVIIDELILKDLSDKDFKKLWHDLHQTTINFWTHVTAPELANYGALPLLEEKLQDCVPKEEIHHIMEVLTAPENPSFYRKEEIELAETDDMKTHQKKYFWLRNSYKEVLIADENFFKNRKKEISPDTRACFEDHQKETKKRKEEIIKKYKLPNEVKNIAEGIVFCIEWQDDRKKDIWIYLHYKDLLLSELCRRCGYQKNDLLNFRELEIEEILTGKTDLKKDIKIRRKGAYGFYAENGNITDISDSAEFYWETYVEEKAGDNVKEIKGIVVSKGKGTVRGRVVIVADSSHPGNFKEGDILVTSMTTPEFVFLMKKAGGIITDTGGLTSHAAIVSRELKKPCIVGTKIATKVLKDGD